MRIEVVLLSLVLIFSPLGVGAQDNSAVTDQKKAPQKVPEKVPKQKKSLKKGKKATDSSKKQAQGKSRLSKEDERIIEALHFLMMLELLKDYELFEEEK